MSSPHESWLLLHDPEEVDEAKLIAAEVDLFQTMSERTGYSPEACRRLFKEELGKFQPVAIVPQPKKHWIDAVPWGWRLVAAASFGLAVYVYGRMAGAW